MSKNITVRQYLENKWRDRESLNKVKERLGASDEFMAGWLTAHVTMDSNKITFDDPTTYVQQISRACKDFMNVR